MSGADLLVEQETEGRLVENFMTNTRKGGQKRMTPPFLQTRLELLESYWASFRDRHIRLSKYRKDLVEHAYVKEDVFTQIENVYSEAKGELLELICAGQTIATTAPRPADGSSPVVIDSSSVPKLKIPTFSGQQKDWESFRELFSSIIKNDARYSTIVKLQHLLNHVEGPAARCLKNIRIVGSNFDVAWNKLLRRYDNKRARLQDHFDILIGLKAVAHKSVEEINRLIDVADDAIQGFKDLGCPVAQWDLVIIHLIVSKLDPETRESWEISREQIEGFPTYKNLEEFLATRVQSLKAAHADDSRKHPSSKSSSQSSPSQPKPKNISAHTTQTNKPKGKQKKNYSCALCQGAHIIGYCETFGNMSPSQRMDEAKKLNLCLRCLRNNHSTSECTVTIKCLVCSGNHHTRLHEGTSGVSTGNHSLNSKVGSYHTESHSTCDTHSRESAMSYATSASRSTLMATAQVMPSSPSGKTISVRALIDPASEESFICQSVARALNLKQAVQNVSVIGVGGEVTAVARASVDLILRSLHNDNFEYKFPALVLKKLTSVLPKKEITGTDWRQLQGLQLADPHFTTPMGVECILAADVYAAVLLPGLRRGPDINHPVAQNSALGWIVVGKSTPQTGIRNDVTHSFNTTTDGKLLNRVNKFWELEELPEKQLFSPDEEKCEQYYRETVSRQQGGRYVVRIPFSKVPSFPDSRSIAVSCLLRGEKRRTKDAELAAAYNNFMHEILKLGHMELVPTQELQKQTALYLPHHSVLKNGDPKKIRVVFNASQRVSNGLSLNDCLLPGPKLQTDLTLIITLWRFSRFVFITDIVKMFRQILVAKQDVDWQRIVWRRDESQPIRNYRLLTVVYGTSSAPFLAIRTLHQLATDEQHRYSRAAEVLRNRTYVDDALCGDDTLDACKSLRDELISILGTAGIQLGKWSANHPELLQGLDDISINDRSLELNETVSTLGLKWYPLHDHFKFKVERPTSSSAITKRSILSEIAKLFDPLGWLSPVLIQSKILLQDLWISGVDWDDSLPLNLRDRWSLLQSQLPLLEEIEIPRWFGTFSNESWEIHGFADASERAYCAAIYVVTRSPSEAYSMLMLAKAKVAPIKTMTLPKLELCGAYLMAKLLHGLLNNLSKKPTLIHCWSDSQVVLAWLRGHPSRWKPFVANRVSETITLLPTATWRHVKSADNPADCGTRGFSPEQLKESSLWWYGPAWLKLDPSHWPSPQSEQEDNQSDSVLGECRLKREPVSVLATRSEHNETLENLLRFSSFTKITHILSYIYRWKSRDTKCSPSYLTAKELAVGEQGLFRAVQRQHFNEEVGNLAAGKALPRTSAIVRLQPFLNDAGILRVGGCLHNAPLPESEKHPIILPGDSPFVRLLVERTHLATLHGGQQMVMSHLARIYWIVRGRQLVQRTVRHCVRCVRFAVQPVEQQMAPLPAVRLVPSRPFSHTGVDYAGPISVRTSKGRGQKSHKGYVAIFICMVVKATHIEIVSDYSSEAFLAAYQRFVARRGYCKVLYSDNGTTFKGADRELRNMFKEASELSTMVAEAVAKDGTSWCFIPPRTPHFGGLWEAGVKSFKHHFRRVLTDHTLTYEELTTLAARIEACLNSRPLCPLSNDGSDLVPLNPGHFLTGAAITAPPEPFTNINLNESFSSRWKLISRMSAHFWSRWRKEVLNQMQQRVKWLKPNHVLREGDIVILKDDLMPPTKWPLARITKTHVGKDGLLRVVTLRTATSEYQRPVVNLIPLLPDEHVNEEFRRLLSP